MSEQQNRQNAAVPTESEQIAIRREKLAAMRADGSDPFRVTSYDIRDYAVPVFMLMTFFPSPIFLSSKVPVAVTERSIPSTGIPFASVKITPL